MNIKEITTDKLHYALALFGLFLLKYFKFYIVNHGPFHSGPICVASPYRGKGPDDQSWGCINLKRYPPSKRLLNLSMNRYCIVTKETIKKKWYVPNKNVRS